MGDIGRAADFLIGGWQISNTTNWSGGLPFTPHSVIAAKFPMQVRAVQMSFLDSPSTSENNEC